MWKGSGAVKSKQKHWGGYMRNAATLAALNADPRCGLATLSVDPHWQPPYLCCVEAVLVLRTVPSHTEGTGIGRRTHPTSGDCRALGSVADGQMCDRRCACPRCASAPQAAFENLPRELLPP